MNEVKVLIEGYAKKITNGWVASSTVTWIKAGLLNIIVDPGCQRSLLLEKLAENNLAVEKIDFVFLTHNHLDHSLLAGIFSGAKVMSLSEVYNNDEQVENGSIIPGTDIEILPTPGHSHDHASLLVKTTNGVYAVAGDVFWWPDGEEQEVEIDTASGNSSKLVASRQKLLQLADYIIPGHGRTFATKK